MDFFKDRVFGQFSVNLTFTTYGDFIDFCAVISGDDLDVGKLREIMARLKQSTKALSDAEKADAKTTAVQS